MKDDDMTIDRLCSIIVARGLEIVEINALVSRSGIMPNRDRLMESNYRYIQLIKILAVEPNLDLVNLNKIRDLVDVRSCNNQKAEEAMSEVLEIIEKAEIFSEVDEDEG